MSYYSNPKYYNEQLLDLKAPEDIPLEVSDLDPAFKPLFNTDNYNQLEFLRKQRDMDQKTSASMKLSANKFADLIKAFGYPDEATSVLCFLKGIGEYDF